MSRMADKAEQEGEGLETHAGQNDPERSFCGQCLEVGVMALLIDHKGLPMRGQLLFDARFEGGGAIKSLLQQHYT